MPGHRRELLVDILENNARDAPDRVFASFPISMDIRQGFIDHTNLQVVQAVDALAWWLHKNVEKREEFQTLSYVGINDMRYLIFFYACVKAGFKALFFSPRNSNSQNASLIRQTQCSHIFFSEKFESMANDIVAILPQGSCRTSYLEEFEAWLKRRGERFPYDKTFEEGCLDPIVAFHSSGSTGDPKVIIQNHLFFVRMHEPPPKIGDRVNGGYDLWNLDKPGYAFCPFPFCHLAGFQSICLTPVFYKTCTAVYGPPDRPATPEMLRDIMKQRTVGLIYAPPSVIEGLLDLPDATELVKKVERIIYAGGPLSKPVGDLLARYVKLSSVYGSTETGGLPCFVPDTSRWQYFEFHPIGKPVFEKISDEAYEMVLKQDEKVDQYRAISATILRSSPEYRTKDLFTPHPEDPKLWRFYGRSDDIIVFSNGQKWNPIPSEAIINTHQDVSGSLIVGQGRFQAALIVEPKNAPLDKDALVRSIWPLVESANAATQRFGRIVKSKIVVVEPSTLIRTPKGTIARKANLVKLESFIDTIYEQASQENGHFSEDGGKYESLEDISLESIKQCLYKCTKLKAIDDQADLFQAGIDSLDVIEIVQALTRRLTLLLGAEASSGLQSSLVFRNPTAARLHGAILRLLSKQPSDHGTSDVQAEECVSRFEYQGPAYTLPPLETRISRVTISGSTGSVGSYLLEQYMVNANIEGIVCLERGTEARSKVQKRLGHLASKLWKKVQFLPVDLQKPDMGLSQDDFTLLRSSQAIIHAAWKVDFNHALESFSDQIRGLLELLRVVSSSPQPQRLFFLSSTGIKSPLASGERVSESVEIDARISSTTGYGQSKYVAERILAKAADEYNIPASVLRIGQVAGPDVSTDVKSANTNGDQSLAHTRPWNPKEWFPTVIRTSNNLGQIPNDLPSVNWVAITKLSSIIGDIVEHDVHKSGLKVYNIVNADETPWGSLLPAAIKSLPRQCEAVPLKKWLKSLQKFDPNDREQVASYPALKLLEYLQDVSDRSIATDIKFSTEHTRQASPTFASMGCINSNQLAFWIEQWLKAGDIPASN